MVCSLLAVNTHFRPPTIRRATQAADVTPDIWVCCVESADSSLEKDLGLKTRV